MLQGSTPPTCPPSLSNTEVAEINPLLSNDPYASIIGALKTTDINCLIYMSREPPPDMKNLILPPSNFLICENTKES
jgi:hypothetical protein